MITVWECELRKYAGVNEKLDALTAEIIRAGEVKSQRETEKRKTRMEAMKEREEFLRRQDMLEAEIEAFSLPPRAIIEKKQSGILLGQMPGSGQNRRSRRSSLRNV